MKTGHAIHKMTTGRITNRPGMDRRETIVWCLTVTDDFTIISGDSRFVSTVFCQYISDNNLFHNYCLSVCVRGVSHY